MVYITNALLIGKKVRLQPNNEQEQTFRRFAGANRFSWNESLAFYESIYKDKGEYATLSDMMKHLQDLKHNNPDYAWLNDIPEAITKQVIKDVLNKWNPDTKISILSVWSILDRNLDEFVADLNDNNKEGQMSVIDGKVITGLKMSDGEPVTGFVIGTAPFTYILPEDEVRKACCTGQQQVKIEITAERILSHD